MGDCNALYVITLLILLLGISFAIAFAPKIKIGIIMYRDMPMSQRLDRIGELLAKGVYLCLRKEKERVAKEENSDKINDGKSISVDSSPSAATLGITKPED
jgi:hypothetical protein